MFVKEIGVKILFCFKYGEAGNWIEDRYDGQFISSYIALQLAKAYTSHLFIKINMFGVGRDEEKLVKCM